MKSTFFLSLRRMAVASSSLVLVVAALATLTGCGPDKPAEPPPQPPGGLIGVISDPPGADAIAVGSQCVTPCTIKVPYGTTLTVTKSGYNSENRTGLVDGQSLNIVLVPIGGVKPVASAQPPGSAQPAAPPPSDMPAIVALGVTGETVVLNDGWKLDMDVEQPELLITPVYGAAIEPVSPSAPQLTKGRAGGKDILFFRPGKATAGMPFTVVFKSGNAQSTGTITMVSVP